MGKLLAILLPCLLLAQSDLGRYNDAYNLALTYLNAGATEKSRQVIQSLIQREDKAELHNLLGEVEEREGHVQQSAEQYEIAARMDPSENNLFDLANELLMHRGFETALKVLDFATGKYPKSARLRVGLGVAHYSLGQYDQAIEALCQAVDLDPKDTRPLDFLGKMYDVAPDKASEVDQRLARIAREYPDNAAANYYYALSLRRRTTGNRSTEADYKAEEHLRQAIKLSPDWADVHYQLGLLYDDQTLFDKAIREYQVAVRLRPDLATAHYRLAQVYQKRGQRELAQAEFQVFEKLKNKTQ